MARPGGTKNGAGPNPYERKARCGCDRPIPQREIGGVSCLKCGQMIRGHLEDPHSAFDGIPPYMLPAPPAAVPAVGRTHRTSGPISRRA